MGTCWTNLENGDIHRLNVEGPELDDVRVGRIRNMLHVAISKGAKGVVIDLQRIDRFDPLGLTGLAMLPKQFAHFPRIVLAGLRPGVQEIALLIHLHDLVDIYEDARAAVFDLATPMNQP